MLESAIYSKAASTWRQYNRHIQRRVAFCARFRESPLGGDPVIAAAFLTEQRREAAGRQVGPQRVELASAAVSAFFELAGRPTPCAHILCANVREVARRTLFPRQRAPGVATYEEVAQLVAFHIRREAPLLARMVVTCAVIAFCGLLRFDDLTHILVHPDLLRIYSDRAELYLFKSKTDQHCTGVFVTIGRVNGPFCPVQLLEALLAAGGYKRTPATAVQPDGSEADAEDVGPLLREVNERTNRLRPVSVALPHTIPAMKYDKFLATLRSLCAAAGLRDDIGTHDFRRGGATALVQNGASRIDVQKLGRWKSDRVFEFAYVREDGARRRALTARITLGTLPQADP
jgi:hypothetical protein